MYHHACINETKAHILSLETQAASINPTNHIDKGCTHEALDMRYLLRIKSSSSRCGGSEKGGLGAFLEAELHTCTNRSCPLAIRAIFGRYLPCLSPALTFHPAGYLSYSFGSGRAMIEYLPGGFSMASSLHRRIPNVPEDRLLK